MIALVLAVSAGLGVAYLYTWAVLGWSGLHLSRNRTNPHPASAPRDGRLRTWLNQAGLAEVDRGQFVAASATFAAISALATFVVFGGVAPAAFVGTLAATAPTAAYRRRRAAAREAARDAWPAMIEEIRLLTGSLGRSVPQALLEVGGRGPSELRPAFAAAEREWLLTTDFARTAEVLKSRLADATADVVVETLLIAHELGGTDLSRRLEALAEDRTLDLMGRKDARARLAGAKFARLFVIAVPLGMAAAGMAVGTGRSSYDSPFGQGAVVIALVLMYSCWVWAGRIMTLPDEPRVFAP